MVWNGIPSIFIFCGMVQSEWNVPNVFLLYEMVWNGIPSFFRRMNQYFHLFRVPERATILGYTMGHLKLPPAPRIIFSH
jgi:hypothetical protein